MNRVILIGRLTRDPELKRTNSGVAVVQFTLAVNRDYASSNGERQADFISCVVWRTQAENLSKYMHKGSQIGIEGRIQIRSYQDQTGANKQATEVICDQIHFLEPKTNKEPEMPKVYTGNCPDETPKSNNKEQFGYQEEWKKQREWQNQNDPFANVNPQEKISDDDLPF